MRLLEADPTRRLGARGAAEVKAHPFFGDVDFEHIRNTPPAFVPQFAAADDTSYFSSRKAVGSLSLDEEGTQKLMRTLSERGLIQPDLLNEWLPPQTATIEVPEKRRDERTLESSRVSLEPSEMERLRETAASQAPTRTLSDDQDDDTTRVECAVRASAWSSTCEPLVRSDDRLDARRRQVEDRRPDPRGVLWSRQPAVDRNRQSRRRWTQSTRECSRRQRKGGSESVPFGSARSFPHGRSRHG
ncbi:hypothetical protein F1559_002615 [Cyanidiococcus yangmingshanensis]|uniref:Uncharacterized protein n=1 Tax=Cyanidiococcus yangmingshanensis TaxID=2690220 RepID=A0A7J7IDY2_9RHOD|nr:hypothetical protein F1559_002615 [Cyanidiococcus yangmingshanensis]